MSDNKYKIIAFDAQYFLHRNFEALKSRTAMSWADTFIKSEDGRKGNVSYLITKFEFDEHDLVRQFFWTIAKTVREKFKTHRIILLWDYPPYHKLKWIPDYKGSRVHHSQDLLDEWDIDKDPQGYLQEKEYVRLEKIKNKAKWWIIDNLKYAGMPSLIFKGYEADDLAYLFSNKVNIEDHCGICSCDSDWMSWISNKVDWLSFNKAEVWTLQDVYDDWDNVCNDLGITLYEAKAYFDSTQGGHNDLGNCECELGWGEFRQLVTELKNNDYSHIKYKDIFINNMNTFNIDKYPDYDNVLDEISSCVSNHDIISDDIFKKLQNRGFKVSEKYFKNNYLPYIDNE
jgi:hypothetical protein